MENDTKGTALDQAVRVAMEAFEAAHNECGRPMPGPVLAAFGRHVRKSLADTFTSAPSPASATSLGWKAGPR